MDEVEKLVKTIYFTPSHPGSFSSADRIKRVLKKKYRKYVSLQTIQNIINDFRSYNMHRSARKNFPRNPIVTYYIDQQWQADLLFLPDLAKFNDNIKIVLVCIDVFSRFAWGEPMKDKSGPETTRAFEAILSKADGRKPDKFQTDDGKEFFNSNFKRLTDKYGINHFSVHSDKKAAIAERFIKTLKSKIYKYLDTHPTRTRYIDNLQDLIKSYNDSYHSTIQMAPSAVTAETEKVVLKNYYDNVWSKNKKYTKIRTGVTRFKKGDTVRISGGNAPFIKGYKGRWTEEIFTVKNVKISSSRPVYKLEDLKGEEIKGIFYDDELQKVSQPSEETEWQIESVLRSRIVKRNNKKIKQYLVKWFGYGPDFNSWVDEKDMKKL